MATATVKVVPDLSGFTEAVARAEHAAVLHKFAKWLSDKGMLNIGGQGWRPNGLPGLVDEYIESGSDASES